MGLLDRIKQKYTRYAPIERNGRKFIIRSQFPLSEKQIDSIISTCLYSNNISTAYITVNGKAPKTDDGIVEFDVTDEAFK